MRPAILHDLQRLYDTHDVFKKQLKSVSPQSAEARLDGIPLRRSTILKKFQNQSLLTRRQVNAHIGKEGADPSEALLVAKEVDKLVTVTFLNEVYSSDSDRLPSFICTKLSSDHMMFFPKTSLFYAKTIQLMDSGQRVLRRCRSLCIQLRRKKKIIRRQ